MNGVLLEVSGHENRALYAGFAGAGNILPAVFPLVAGLIIDTFGYRVFFSIFIIIILSSIFFIKKINCKK
jgi:MFS family permease